MMKKKGLTSRKGKEEAGGRCFAGRPSLLPVWAWVRECVWVWVWLCGAERWVW